MFWNDPVLYGATFPYKEFQASVQPPFAGSAFTPWQNIPRFSPSFYGFQNPIPIPLQPPFQPPYQALQPPFQPPYQALQPPFQLPYQALQPPVQLPYQAMQPPFQLPYQTMQAPLFNYQTPFVNVPNPFASPLHYTLPQMNAIRPFNC